MIGGRDGDFSSGFTGGGIMFGGGLGFFTGGETDGGKLQWRLCEGEVLLNCILAKKDNRYSEKDATVVVRQLLKVAAHCHLHESPILGRVGKLESISRNSLWFVNRAAGIAENVVADNSDILTPIDHVGKSEGKTLADILLASPSKSDVEISKPTEAYELVP
uniref:Uncharacterized protein n=1 Tax=Chenopodium quinoa TaxID=63459 RepID=A0A803NDB0_CHEQI